MNGDPRLLIWNFLPEEKNGLDVLLQKIGAPVAVAVTKCRGKLTLRDIIHSEAESEEEFSSEEKVVLFYNVPQNGVFFLIDVFKKAGLPTALYAVVTKHSIEWPFCELLEHLVRERDSRSKD